jgi:hypothetical protein
VDHCSFIDGDIAIRRMGDNDASWLRPIVAGTLNSLIIEDNSFLINSNFGAGVYETCGSVNQQIYHDSYGARTTIRNNNFDYSACPYYNDAHIEAHGNWDVTRGSPLIEVYNNILHLNRGYRFMHFRGGSIIIFNNTMIYDYGSRPAAIGLTD